MYEKYSVLFVDDEVNILNSIRRGLIDEEYQSYFASSGKEALDIMENKNIHVIITDMKMPEMTGLDLLKIVEEKWPLTVKIVLSGYTQLPQILVTINQVDIFKFLTKPWELNDLLSIIKKALDYYIIHEENDNYKKILERKNEAYQNILKRMDDVINESKNSNELLGQCGKVIFGFEKKFNVKDRIKYHNIFSIHDDIFEIISKAVINEKKEYLGNDIIEYTKAKISELLPLTKFENIPDINTKFHANIKMYQAVIAIILLVFEDEFQKNGIMTKIEYDNKLSFSFVCPKVALEDSHVLNNETTLLDVKMDFLKTFMSVVLMQSYITLQMLIKNGNLILRIGIEE